jgi:hypothetical protein
MRIWTLIAVALAAAAAGFAVGRSTDTRRPAAHPAGSYADGYRAGREDAFSGFDGGWGLGEPYIVILRRGRAGTTYEFARRWPLRGGRGYRSCRRDLVCSRRVP